MKPKKGGVAESVHRPQIFVSSSAEGIQTAYALQANLEHVADVTIWNTQLSLGYSLLEALLDALAKADFSVAIFRSDDSLMIRGQEMTTVRDSVIFELGISIGRLGLRRCFILMPEHSPNLRVTSDLVGLATLSYKSDPGDRNFVAALGPACSQIARAVVQLGPLKTAVRRTQSRAADRLKSNQDRPARKTGRLPEQLDSATENKTASKAPKPRPTPRARPTDSALRPIDLFLSYSHRDEKLEEPARHSPQRFETSRSRFLVERPEDNAGNAMEGRNIWANCGRKSDHPAGQRLVLSLGFLL